MAKMDNADAVVEAPWCVACRRSSDRKWKKHVFTRAHQHAARQFLLGELSRLQTLAESATTTADPTASSPSWWCIFCEANSEEREQAVEHCASAAHRKRVEAFCREYKCDQDRQIRAQLVLTPEKRRQLLSALTQQKTKMKQKQEEGKAKAQHHKEQNNQKDETATTGDQVEIFLSSAASRLEEVHAQAAQSTDRCNESQTPINLMQNQQEALLGVVQHPLGQHDGQRVWGGGIVKVKRADWLSWAIDWLVKHEMAQHATGSVDDISGDGFQKITEAYSHRVTKQAYGEGLNSIASVPWRSSVGNVHTAAVPPWMAQSEDEYKQCNRREQPVFTTQGGAELPTDGRKKRDIFSVLEDKKSYGSDWLPNFGGVWQEGPRSRTKQAFRKSVKSVQSRTAGAPSNSSAVQPQVQAKVHLEPATQYTSCLSASTVLETSQPQQQDKAVHPPPVDTTVPAQESRHPEEKQPQTPLPPAAPSSSAETESTVSTNPLDTKKRLLAAQKERLRAKMAARRRR